MFQRSWFLFLVLAVLACLVSGPAWADEATGTVVKVDNDKQTLIVKVDGQEYTGSVAKDAKITVDGKTAKLADLKVDQKVKVTYTKEGEKITVTEIAADEKKQAPPPEQGTVNTKDLGGYENDFIPGRTPTKEEIAKIEKEVAANPDDFKLVRKLGVGYFYRAFGAKEAEAAPKAQETLAHALELKKNDGLTIAFQGSLAVVAGDRLPDLKGRHDELFQKARELEPNNVGILSLAAAAYAGKPEQAIEITERIRKLLGPEFKTWSRHGQQQILITQGRAYARTGRLAEARACFEDGLAVNRATFQAELDKLKK